MSSFKKKIVMGSLFLIQGLLCLFASDTELKGKQFYQKDRFGFEKFYYFKNDGTFLHQGEKNAILTGYYESGSDEKGDFIDFYYDDVPFWLSTPYEDARYYYLVKKGVLVFYTESELIDVYYPDYWRFLDASYQSNSESGKYRAENLYSPQGGGYSQNLRRYWREEKDREESPSFQLEFLTPGHQKAKEEGAYPFGCIIFNGAPESRNNFSRYNRARDMLLMFLPGKRQKVSLEDTARPQIFLFDPQRPSVEVHLFVSSEFPGEENSLAMTRVIFFGKRTF